MHYSGWGGLGLGTAPNSTAALRAPLPAAPLPLSSQGDRRPTHRAQYMEEGAMPAEGWAIELKGDPLDVDDAREALQPPFDPWIEDYVDGTGNKFTLIRTAAWTTLPKGADVARDAQTIIERLNGAARLIHEDARPLAVGEVFSIDAAGKRMHILVAETGYYRLSFGRMRAQVQSSTPRGPPVESNIQRWLREAKANDHRENCSPTLRGQTTGTTSISRQNLFRRWLEARRAPFCPRLERIKNSGKTCGKPPITTDTHPIRNNGRSDRWTLKTPASFCLRLPPNFFRQRECLSTGTAAPRIEAPE